MKIFSAITHRQTLPCCQSSMCLVDCGLKIQNRVGKPYKTPRLQWGRKAWYLIPTTYLQFILNTKLMTVKFLRLSYFSAINIAGFFEYVPFTVSGDNWDIGGNPYLQHTTSENYDIRYELFPKGIDQVLLGAFYKTIENPIEEGIVFNGTSSAKLVPQNYGTATNYGVEAAITHFWKNWHSGQCYLYPFRYYHFKTLLRYRLCCTQNDTDQAPAR